jgi:hypothetical protein
MVSACQKMFLIRLGQFNGLSNLQLAFLHVHQLQKSFMLKFLSSMLMLFRREKSFSHIQQVMPIPPHMQVKKG